MTRAEAMRLTYQQDTLRALGFTIEECESLRRISMTLHRWHELECGDGNNYVSWAIERDEQTDIPYMVYHTFTEKQPRRERIADREKGAQKRLAAILAARNGKTIPAVAVEAYIQTDPRGAALYIIRPGDVPEGSKVDSCYSRGICVY